jgi:hypothetical protein
MRGGASATAGDRNGEGTGMPNKKPGPAPTVRPPKVAIAAKVAPEVAALLARWAADEGRTRSALLRELVTSHVEARARLLGAAA